MLSTYNRFNMPAIGLRAASSVPNWSHVPQAPADPILGVAAAYRVEKRKDKVNLSIGAYRDEIGRPYVLQCVREAEARLVKNPPGHEYLPIAGLESFSKGALKMALGPDGEYIEHNRVSSVQALSGTGSLTLAASFLRSFAHKDELGNLPSVYLPSPTWGNHKKIFPTRGVSVKEYRYWDKRTGLVDIEGLLADVKAAPAGSVFLFHACAHNPTGADPTHADWERIYDAVKSKKHVVIFDSAYQGFASGDPENDAYALRLFAKRGAPPLMMICQSFAKNLGLYGERVGALHVVCQNPQEAQRVKSQLQIIIRAMYSNPPAWGARLADQIFADRELTMLWRKEMAMMAGRIGEMRGKLVDALRVAGSKRDWEFIKKQIGMFSFTGMTKRQCQAITNEHAVYLTMNGRISMAGLNDTNVDKVAKAIHDVTTRY